MMLLLRLAVETGLSLPELLSIVDTAPRRYKVYQIPKKSGGWREIAHPARELKILQRFVLDNYLSKYPVHDAAAAYVRGKNIYENASYHSCNPFFLKLDFQSFFPSIKVSDWNRFVKDGPQDVFHELDADYVKKILFWGAGTSRAKCLSIGAPSSPLISNIMLFDLDTRLSNLADDHRVRYTRYADDITLSAATVECLLDFEKVVRREVTQLRSPKLKFNDAKRGLFGRGQRRLVTGLVVTPQGRVSLGRERKRLISALIHKLGLGLLDIEQKGLLKGLLGFAVANEPSFLDRMRAKYGDSIIDEALRMHIPSRRDRGLVKEEEE
jgi:hypothetical protein